MKKVISIFLAALMIMSLFSIAAFASEEPLNVEVETKEAHKGQQVVVNLNITEEIEAVGFMIHDITYDETQLKLVKGTWTLKNGFLKQDWKKTTNDASFLYETNRVVSGKIFALTFEVLSDVECGDFAEIACEARAVYQVGEGFEDIVTIGTVEAGGVTITHNPVKDTKVAATCTKTGLTEGSHCKECGEVIKAQTKVAKKAHTYKNVVTKADAKNKKNGKITPTCSVCGAKKTATTIYYPKTVTLKYTATTYTGKALKPTVTVKDSKGNKIATSNYTVSYKSNTNVGKATVTITFKGNYKGTLTKTFKINPKGTTVSKLTAKSKGFTATWKKQATQTTGYEIQYSTSSKFTEKTTKTIKVANTKTVTKAISKLKASTKYYVRIRTYKTVSKTNYYSAWSKALSVTTKK